MWLSVRRRHRPDVTIDNRDCTCDGQQFVESQQIFAYERLS